MLLESCCHSVSSMVTLTYAVTVPSLVPRDLVLFLKRLRKRYPRPLRYYGVGEYGDRFFRPHFHLALFGHDPQDVEAISLTWGLGGVHVCELNNDTAQYLTGYVTKKIGQQDWRIERDDLHPEFARMSRRPGLGAHALRVVAESLMSYGGAAALAEQGDVPSSIKVGGKTFPLGRYLRGELRTLVGWPKAAPMDSCLKASASVLLEGDSREKRRYCHELSAEFRAKLSASMRRL